MTTTKSYDYVNRLTGISSTSAVAAVSFAYAYNDANQRTRVDEADGSYWLYEYDSLGQVTSAKRYASGGYIMPGQQHEYTYDDIGNRKTAKSGGNQFGASLRESTYGVNALNQYTNRTVPGYLEVQGSANASATVTVNNESTTRQGAYYRKELTVNNAPSAVWQSITNVAVLAGAGTNGTDIVTTLTGSALVPKTPEAFTYDADGNLTSDGRLTYTWDAENRLLQVESLTNAPTGARVKVTWTYDARNRRIQQQSYTEQSGTLVLTSNLKFLADGWRHIAELNATNNASLKTYAWGLDLSGSLDGAGGVGGLLFFRDTSTHFYSYDGNGNVRALFSANDGTLTAQYDYDAFGNTVRATGSAALANPFRFSTKRTDDLTSLVLYEYRAYAPLLGRWSTRDPLEELAGASLTGICKNDLINSHDIYGLIFGLNAAGAVVGGAEIGYDFCQNIGDFKVWMWIGLGYYSQLTHRWIGPYWYYEYSKHIKFGNARCGECCCDTSASAAGGGVAYFQGFQNALKGATGIDIGILPQMTPCGIQVEGIALFDVVNGTPHTKILKWIMQKTGGDVKTGGQINVSIEICKLKTGGWGLTHGRIAGGVFFEIGWVPENLPPKK